MAKRLAWGWPTVLFIALVVIHSPGQRLIGQPVPGVPPIQAGQPGLPPGPGNADPSLDLAGVSLPRNNRLESQLQAAQEYTQAKNWPEATSILQKLLELPEDVLVSRSWTTTEGATTQSMVSIRQEANRLVANLPRDGKKVYQLTYGGLADGILKEAKEKGSPSLLGDILRIYLHTQAGADAALLLGTYQLDRGNYLSASLCFEKLIEREGIEAVTPTALARAALAFHMSGDLASRDKMFAQMRQRGLRDVKLINEPVGIDDWKNQLGTMVRSVEAGVNDWPMVGGNPKRNASTNGGAAFLEPNWRKSTVRFDESKSLLSQAVSAILDRQNPLIPGMIPLSETVSSQGKTLPLVVYRSHWGLHAVNLKSGELEWESPNEWSIDGMLNPKRMDTTRRRQAVQEWMEGYTRMGSKAAVAVENTVTGTLSSDGQRVYGINDLQVPPLVANQYGMPFDPSGGSGGFGRYGSEVADAISSNRLRAYDLANGKLRWETGGKKFGTQGESPVIDLSDSHFLGAPLPIANKLYALNEKQQEIRLLSLDPESGKPLSSQTLVSTKDRLNMDLPRKIQAAHLAYGDGILVCPTNAGAIMGVDMLTGSLVWSFLYREAAQTTAPGQEAMMRRPNRIQIQMMQGIQTAANFNLPTWQSAPPMISGDKVIFTSPYARSLFCLNLRTGVKVWSQPRSEDDVYLAGIHAGKVLVVGKRTARGIDLQTGKTAWTVETGMPSGYGAASGSLYYLPLRESAKSKEPEICTIDMALGKVVAHTISRKKEIPGNLVFHLGEVLSQGSTDITVYSQLAVRLAQIDEKIRQNPNNPEGLADRGELRLDKGDIEGAIADLDAALKNSPSPVVNAKARLKLFEAFTEAFQENYPKWEPMIGRFKEMCAAVNPSGEPTPSDQVLASQRRTVFLGLVARGREKQGRLLEAARDYDQLADSAAPGTYFTPNDDSGLRITPEALARGRFRIMLGNANPELKSGLESYLSGRLDALKTDESKKDALKSFTASFGEFFPGGRKMGADLTRAAADEGSTLALLEAERFLGSQPGQVPANWSPAEGAQALDSQAVLYQNRGLLPDAAVLLSDLAKRYPDQMVRSGITSAKLFNDLAADRRFLPYLAEPQMINPTGPVKVVEERSSNVPRQAVPLSLFRDGPGLPFFDRTQFVLQTNPNQASNLSLRATSMATGETWELALSGPNLFQNIINNNPGSKRQGISYQTSGHLMILWVANWVYAVDPIRRKVLWEQNLTQSKTNPATALAPVQLGDPRPQPQIIVNGPGGMRTTSFNNGTGIMLDPTDGLLYQTREDGWKQRVGMVGTVTEGILPVLNQEGLMGLDPMTGRVLWVRSDIRADHLLLGASDGYLFLVRTSMDGTVNGTRAVRAIDGQVLDVPDFSKEYRNRIVMNGSRVISFEVPAANEKDPEKKTGPRLKVIDLLANKELVNKVYPPDTRAIACDGGNLGGVILPSGEVEIFQLPDGKALPKLKVDPVLVDKAPLYLLADSGLIYLISQKPEDQVLGAVQSNFMGQVGLKFVRANGEVYAFRRDSGKLAWRNNVTNQLMVLDHFQNLPMVIFSSRYNRQENGPNSRTLVNVISHKAYDKRTGKLILDKDTRVQSGYFHMFQVDLRAGRLDLIEYQNRISFFWGSGLALADASKPSPAPNTVTSSTPTDGTIPRGGLLPGGVNQGLFIAPVPIRRVP